MLNWIHILHLQCNHICLYCNSNAAETEEPVLCQYEKHVKDANWFLGIPQNLITFDLLTAQNESTVYSNNGIDITLGLRK